MSARPASASPLVAIIGGGPAGLMAAEVLANAGVRVELFDAMPSVGRKFLLAGVGGMNITHSESKDAFIGRYGERQAELAALLREETIALLRLMVGEAVHLPEFREAFLQAFPLFLLGRTRAILEGAAANGVITLDRPDVSVRMLVGPLVSYVMFGGLLLSGPPQPPERGDVEWLVDAYLRTLDDGPNPC